MGKRLFLLVGLWFFCVLYGADHCLTELNRAIGPEEELRAFRFEVVSETSYRVEILEISLVIDIPPAVLKFADRLHQETGVRLARLEQFVGIRP